MPAYTPIPVTSGAGSGTISCIQGEQVDVSSADEVIWQGSVDMTTVTAIRLLTMAKVTSGTGTAKVLVGGNASDPATGTLVASATVVGTSFAISDSAQHAVSFAGTQLIKVVGSPPPGQTLSMLTADMSVT